MCICCMLGIVLFFPFMKVLRNEAAKYPATLTAPRNLEDSLGKEEDDNEDYKGNKDDRGSIGGDTSMKPFLRDFPKSWLQSQAENFTAFQKVISKF